MSLPQSVVAGSERVRISVVGKYNQYYNTIKPAHVVTSITDPGSFKLTDISYRLRFSFVSFACNVRWFFVFRSFAFRSCNWFIRLVYRSFRFSFVSFVLFAFFVRLRLVCIVNLYDPGSVLLIVLRENIFNKCIFSIIYSTDK